MTALKESDLRLFVDSVRRYFDITSRITPEITSAFLGVEPVAGHDFNGIVRFAGRYRGQVLVSLPAAALKELLLLQRETDLSPANLLDAVGEIANTLAGNARRRLGKDLDISVPQTVHGHPAPASRTRMHPYVITFRWNRYPGLVCVDLAEAA
ncbi:MAG: chemotaxis protein CheX [Burkholderiales bacterium]|nr:chemotaxis protein CheX [Burkholderiales bacterium]